MAATPMLTVFAYDITEDRRRVRVAALLEQKLTRVQDSLFEGWLTAVAARALAERASLLLDDTDSLRVYAVPRRGLRHCHSLGPLPLMAPHDYWLL